MTDPATTTDPKTPEGKAPEFDGEFDAERAKRLVANLRADLDKARADLKTATDALTAREDAEKTELQKATDKAARLEEALKSANTEAARTKAAAKHNLPDDLIPFLTGETEEEIEAKAKSLATYAAKKDDAEETEPVIPGKPTARLVPGSGADTGGASFDPRAVADAIRTGL